MTSLTALPAWTALAQHQDVMSSHHLRDLFSNDPLRFQRFSIEAAKWTLDYSKNHIDEKTIDLLMTLAKECKLQEKIEALFTGQFVNQSENRAALHTALRDQSACKVAFNGLAVAEQIQTALSRMQSLVDDIHQNKLLGFNQTPITDLVHVGIGGSHLGPHLVYDALVNYRNSIVCHFVAAEDSASLNLLLDTLNPASTLVIIVSKSFTTYEVLQNANQIKTWLLTASENARSIQDQFIAVTANVEKAKAFGLSPHHIFPMWDWIGGRYSVWSAVSLSVAICIGMENFYAFLKGAYAMDQHYRHTPFKSNMPVILGMLGIWYNNFFHTPTKSIVPYSARLKYFPAFLQQLCMESQGKRVRHNGEFVDYKTGMIIWGGLGLNCQHSFHQLYMQGTRQPHIDFIVSMKDANHQLHHDAIANCLAQSQTLMLGVDEDDNHKKIPGNCPSNVLLTEQLTPSSLGALMALYEHVVYTQSVIWDINAFDQWGVERGKLIANQLLEDLKNKTTHDDHDVSTKGLLSLVAEVD